MTTNRQPSKLLAAEGWRRPLRWTGAVALLALTPKCLLCAAAYLGVGAALGLNVPELCGSAPNAVPTWATVVIVVCVVAVAWTVFAFMRWPCKASVLPTPRSEKAYPRQSA